MASPISPMEAIAIVQKAVVLYKKIQDAPEAVKKVGKRMERLESYLVGLKELLADKKRHSLASLRPAQTQELRLIIQDIQSDSKKVYDILHKWDNNIGPFGFQLRFKTIGQALFALGSSTDKLDNLSEDIKEHRNDLRDYLQLLEGFKLNTLQPGGPSKQRPASPSPHPLKKDYRLIFVDAHNTDRSRVGQAFVRLVQEWTTRTGGQWPVNLNHSAGLNVKEGGNCTTILENLTPPLVMVQGGSTANVTALEALYDNKLFNYPWKKTFKEVALKSKSRGIREDIFKKYDFILVFTGREVENLTRLKVALRAKDGRGLVPRGKGRIIHLGSYLAKDGNVKDITSPAKNKDGTDSREKWNKTVGVMKAATKLFLKSETGWVQPLPGASQ